MWREERSEIQRTTIKDNNPYSNTCLTAAAFSSSVTVSQQYATVTAKPVEATAIIILAPNNFHATVQVESSASLALGLGSTFTETNTMLEKE